MTFEEYQTQSRKTAMYPKIGEGYVYPALGLCGEAGEVADQVKKVFRDNNGVLDEARKKVIASELGDVLWYVAQLATEIGVPLEEVAAGNLEKLFSRLERGKIHGDGNER